MNADAELDAALGRQAGVALDEAILHLDGAARRVDHAAELDEASVSGALDDAPAMRGDGGIDQIAAQSPKARQRAILVRAGKPAIADHVRNQDRRTIFRISDTAHPHASCRIAQEGLSSAVYLAKAIGTEGSHPRRLWVVLTEPRRRPGTTAICGYC